MSEIITKPYKPKIRLQMTEGYLFVNTVVRTNRLHTVCEEARGPNIYECWDRRTATIMILGDICTRNSPFCAVGIGVPDPPDPEEPKKLAQAITELNLN